MARDCANCEQPISEQRLKALPHTTLCVSCQREQERAGKFVRHKIDVQQVIESWENVGVVQTLVRGSKV
jgi:hypothetical protein